MTETTDRYVTYKNIDCEGNARQLMTMLLHHLEQPGVSNPFWEKFKGKLSQVGKPQANSDRCLDALFLIHTYINNLYELFEEQDDARALELLDRIERECC